MLEERKVQSRIDLTKKINIICNRCGNVACELRGSEEFPYDFKGIRTVEKHWPMEDWFAEIVCMDCANREETL